MFASLVALDGFHLLLSTQLTAKFTLEWSGGSMFHSLSHIYAKTPFCCVGTIVNNALNRRRIVVFDRLHGTHFEHNFLIDTRSWKMVNTLPSDIFNSSAISCSFNLRSTQMILWGFGGFPGELSNLGDLSVQHHLCLYGCV